MSTLTSETRDESAATRRPDPDPAPRPIPQRRRLSLGKRMWRARWMYLFILPGVLYFVVFKYLPLLGNIAAFQQYSPFQGFAGSPWVGLGNFAALLTDPEFLNALRNTLVLSAVQIVFAFPAPIALAIFLNSILSDRVKRTIQSIVYLPHFLSWVIIVALWQEVFGATGAVNDLMRTLGLGTIDFTSNPNTFVGLITSQVIWKEVGWGTIIFLAAIALIPTERYESAALDGANSWKQIWHITLPGMSSVIVLLLILRLGTVLTVGFEQILLQQNAVGADAGEVLDTYTYFRGVLGGDWGLATAAGLVKGLVGTVLVIGANRFAKRMGGQGII